METSFSGSASALPMTKTYVVEVAPQPGCDSWGELGIAAAILALAMLAKLAAAQL